MLVFVHGMWTNKWVWENLISYFEKRGYECTAVDLKKEFDLKKTYFSDYVNKVKAIVGKNDVLIGHSLGGLIVQKIAEDSKIKGGIALCPAAPKGIRYPNKIILSSLRYLPQTIIKKPVKPSLSFAQRYFLNSIDKEHSKEYYGKFEEDSSIVGYELVFSKIEVDESRVTCPLMFIATTEDRTCTPETVEKIARKYDTEMILKKGCHWIFVEWKSIAEEISRFLIESHSKKS